MCIAKESWLCTALRCNDGRRGGNLLSSTTRPTIMHQEQRRRLVLNAEHEAVLAMIVSESGGASHAA